MGWKLSFVFIENAAQERDDSILLNCIKKTDYSYQSTLTLNDFHRLEKGILIGEIDNHIIISDNYELSGKILERRKKDSPSPLEKNLSTIYPQSEILTVACHSVTNFHGYSLVKKNKQIRYKTVSADEELKSYGTQLPVEKLVYASDLNMNQNDEIFDESLFMEEFTSAIISKILNLDIMSSAGEKVFTEIKFKLYQPHNKEISYESPKSKTYKTLRTFIKFILYFLLFLTFKWIFNTFIK